MVEAISVMAIIMFGTVAVAIIAADIRKVLRKYRFDKYVRKQSECKHEYKGRIFDESVCIYCGKVLR